MFTPLPVELQGPMTFSQIKECMIGSTVAQRRAWPSERYASISPNGLVDIIQDGKRYRIGHEYPLDHADPENPNLDETCWANDLIAMDWTVIPDPNVQNAEASILEAPSEQEVELEGETTDEQPTTTEADTVEQPDEPGESADSSEPVDTEPGTASPDGEGETGEPVTDHIGEHGPTDQHVDEHANP